MGQGGAGGRGSERLDGLLGTQQEGNIPLKEPELN